MPSLLPTECLTCIFAELETHKSSIYSCIRVNREWCNAATPFLWKNPFSLKKYTPSQSLKLYREHVESNKQLISELSELKGKTLGCWCKPNPCHGDILIELIDKHCNDQEEDDKQQVTKKRKISND